MIRSALLPLLLSAILASAAGAATRVQSGDHVGFARLVIYFDRGQEWSLEKTEAGYRLEAPGLSEGYDVSEVFEMIQKDRISDISSTEDVLSINLACNCIATTTELSSGQLVVDISDPSPSDATAPGAEVAIATPEPIETEEVGTSAPQSTEVNQVTPLPLPTIELPTNLVEPSLDLAPAPEPETPLASSEELAEFRKRLLENLGRSASLSLIDLAEQPEELPETPTTTSDQIVVNPEQSDRAHISNAVDDALDPRANDTRPLRRATCPDLQLFEIGQWGSEDGFVAQIAEIRRNLLGEFDEVDAQQVLSLARAYLHYGLTDEARHVIKQFAVGPEHSELISTLSRLMDGETGTESDQFKPFDHCGGPIIPWRLLDRPKTAEITEEQRQMLAAEFSKWPKSLQERLGPTLMDILAKRGFETTASFLNAIIGDGTPAVETELVGPSAPLEEIKNGVEEGDPEALADLLRRTIDDRMPIEDRFIELASAFERETAGTALSDRLHDLRVEAIAFRGDVPQLTSIIEKELTERTYSAELVLSATSHVMSNATAAQQTIFSSFLLRTDLIALLPDSSVIQIADHFAGSGLPNLAEQVLATRAQSTVPVSLEASLAWSDRETERLAGTLTTLSDPEERDQRANAILNAATVNTLPEAVVDELSRTTQDRVAWASSDWENVTSDGPERNISQLILDLGELELADTPLTTARNIREKASETRSILSEILTPTSP